MVAIEVKEQVRIIRKAGKEAGKSKASALKFLKEAGIITATKPSTGRRAAPKRIPAKVRK